jgi:hypothetical protein
MTTDVPLTNADAVAAMIRQLNAVLPSCPGPFVPGAIQTNYYSITFPVDTGDGDGVFVKIPKGDLRGSNAMILPIGGQDRDMARHESQSLRALAQRWPGEAGRVRWVSLLGELPEFNALITNRVRGDEAFVWVQHADLWRRVGRTTAARSVRDAMFRLGQALGGFHQSEVSRADWNVAREAQKLVRYAASIGTGTSRRSLDVIPAWLEGIARHVRDGMVTTTLKGIDLRNVLIEPSGNVTLLDPGRMKATFREADLARFVLTYRIAHWGRWWFPIVGRPDPQAEADFLRGYATAGGPPLDGLYRVFLVKEILKHWHTALETLETRTWPPVVKRWVRSVYIDAFYQQQLAAELRSAS